MKKEIKLEDLTKCLEILEELSLRSEELNTLDDEKRLSFIKSCGLIARPTADERKKRKEHAKKTKRRQRVSNDRMIRKKTGIRSARDTSIFIAPKLLEAQELDGREDSGEYSTPKECYVCRAKFTKIHHFYDSMCTNCGDLNYFKRFQETDLTGQVALITGSRLKIGYHATLMMLRSGAEVIATTRFPVDSALRFSKEEDFEVWQSRLHIYGLDLRHTPSVEIFCQHIESQFERLDILINNAAQTVRRPSEFYAHLMKNERLLPTEIEKKAGLLLKNHFQCLNHLQIESGEDKNLPLSWQSKAQAIGMRSSAELSQIPYSIDHALDAKEVFPVGQLDADLQQVDLRKVNSWRLKLGQIPIVEMVEVQLVNAIAPFVLCNRLVAMMRRDYTGKKHIVNVSAMEGKFHRFKKEDRHPHTNMAKAALNMMTHTAASDFARDGIFINAVDTGWVTDEDPIELAKRKQEVHDFQPPLDIVDGAARVCDPFIDGINSGKHWSGKFLKDYFPIDW